MARCWTCGASVATFAYSCSGCATLRRLASLDKKVESYGEGITDQLDLMRRLHQAELHEISEHLAQGLSAVVSAIEWGFDRLLWKIEQQTEVLLRIDHTLKAPAETQANEWRRMADALRQRGVLEEAEEFYLKALDRNRLDYRIYIGLAGTYLERMNPDLARIYLEKSLPHAPIEESVHFDWKSHSYRLIGHIHGCQEDYTSAEQALRLATQLSPAYSLGHYDLAQYRCLTGDLPKSISSLSSWAGSGFSRRTLRAPPAMTLT